MSIVSEEAVERGKGSTAPDLQPTMSSCFWLNPAGFPTERQRTLVMTGVARSGTSFIGSVAGQLGIPHARTSDDRVSGHWEHYALRVAFKEKNEEEFASIVSEFNQSYDIWGWKLPSLRTDFEWVMRHVRNPCFVITFKEPLSMAMRKISTGHQDNVGRHFKRIFSDYQQLVEFATTSKRPVMLVSYDKALRQLDECIAAIAKFGGVERYDPEAVKAGIADDATRY
ncbi:MAG: hypothetical protein KIS73_07265 [Enhydrobacter sp.]|nr:hypothetical protein [Enhydrobacter sp.]